MTCSAPPGQQKVTPALRGVLAEIATSGVIRYWAASTSGLMCSAVRSPFRLFGIVAYVIHSRTCYVCVRSGRGCHFCTRYPWPLVRTLLAELMEQVLVEFEAEAHVEVRGASAQLS